MKHRYFFIGLVAMVLSSCGFGKHPLVGKWQCVNPKSEYLIIVTEFLADGTRIQNFKYTSRPPSMDDTQWDRVNKRKDILTTTWKAIEGDRITVNIDGKTSIFAYKINGNSLQFDPPDGDKCEKN